MSQHDFDIANQGFAAFRADLNNALKALGSTSSGTAEPATTYANQLWYETDTNTLHIRNEANSAWLDLMTIDQTTGSPSFPAGNVGIGTSSPVSKLDVNGDVSLSAATTEARSIQVGQGRTSNGIAFVDLIGDTTYSDYGLRLARWNTGANTTSQIVHRGTGALAITATDAGSIRFDTTNASRMSIDSAGSIYMPYVYADTVTGRDLYISSTGQLGYVSSTRASKTNIEDLSDVSWLYSLNPVSFQYRVRNEDDTYSDEAQPQPEYGLIAEEVEEVNPDLVFYDETESGKELRGVQYSRLIAPLLKAIQEQQKMISALEARIVALGG